MYRQTNLFATCFFILLLHYHQQMVSSTDEKVSALPNTQTLLLSSSSSITSSSDCRQDFYWYHAYQKYLNLVQIEEQENCPAIVHVRNNVVIPPSRRHLHDKTMNLPTRQETLQQVARICFGRCNENQESHRSNQSLSFDSFCDIDYDETIDYMHYIQVTYYEARETKLAILYFGTCQKDQLSA